MNEHYEPRGGRRGRPPFPSDDDPRARRRGRPDFDGAPGFDGRMGGGRMRRGDVRTAVLLALRDEPGHGYQVIQALEEKSQGRWRPSPGSVYPLLQLLADEGLVTSTEQDGKRIFELTAEGRTEADEHADHVSPWEAMDRGRGDHGELRSAIRDLMLASKQISTIGSAEVATKATEILTKARKDLYRLLADS